MSDQDDPSPLNLQIEAVTSIPTDSSLANVSAVTYWDNQADMVCRIQAFIGIYDSVKIFQLLTIKDSNA